MADTFRYAAFISYSSKDAVFARKLHRAVETYAIPKPLGRFELTTAARRNRLYPVFRDREEMPAGELGALIQDNLQQASALIVICSPNSAASSWVQKEIEHFIALGRQDRVFAVIAEDVPLEIGGRKTTADCFPLALRAADGGLNPVAADARREKDGFHNALLKLVAGVIGVSPGELADRDKKRRRQRAALAGAGVIALAAGAAAYWVSYFQPAVSYASDYARRDGVWREVGAVSEAIARARATTYEFRRNGVLNPPNEVRIVNGYGSCAAEGFSNVLGHSLDDKCNAARACAVRFAYTRDGQIAKETTVDQYGAAMETLSYSAPSVGQFTEAGFGCSRSASGIQYVRFTRFAQGPARGFDQRVEFFHQQGRDLRGRPNNDGAFALEYERSATGAVLAQWSIGRAGQRALTRGGYAGVRFMRRGDGAIVRRDFVDGAGKSVLTSQGVAAIAETRDTAGNLLRLDFLDAAGAPAIETERGVASIAYTYAPRGEAVSESAFGPNGAATLFNAGYARSTSEYDKRGYVVSSRYFDEQGRPTLSRNGDHLQRVARGDAGEALSSSYFDTNDKPTLRQPGTGEEKQGGFHRLAARFDRRGNRVEQIYYGLDGRPTIEISEQIAGYRKTYDQFNREIESVALGVDLRPTADSIGAFVTRYRYDEHGNLLYSATFDADGKPMPDGKDPNVYATELRVDELGRTVWIAGLDANGRVVVNSQGWAIRKMRYNDDGDKIADVYFDADDKPTRNGDGAHEVRYLYDHAHRDSEESDFGLAGEPILNAYGFHISRLKYDARGRLVEQAYFGVRGEPIALGSSPTSRNVFAYDERGNEISLRFFGVDGKLVLGPDGNSGSRSEFDARGNRVKRVYLGLRDEPVALPRAKGGFAEARMEYNLRGAVTSVAYFDAAGRPTRNLEDAPPGRDEGYFKFERDYDSSGNETETRYLGADNRLARGITTQARVTLQYDSNGRVTERRFFDADNKPFTNPVSGRAIERRAYDALGRQVESTSFDIADRPVNRRDTGWYRQTLTYDEKGAVTATCHTVAGAEKSCD